MKDFERADLRIEAGGSISDALLSNSGPYKERDERHERLICRHLGTDYREADGKIARYYWALSGDDGGSMLSDNPYSDKPYRCGFDMGIFETLARRFECLDDLRR